VTIELTPEQERIIANVIRSGAYRDAKDVIGAALGKLAETMEERNGQARPSRLWELRRGLNLGEVSIREFIDEGRE
jgi:Arc/MetJ-type ribon-helix-helix transcriptional regulator